MCFDPFRHIYYFAFLCYNKWFCIVTVELNGGMEFDAKHVSTGRPVLLYAISGGQREEL